MTANEALRVVSNAYSEGLRNGLDADAAHDAAMGEAHKRLDHYGDDGLYANQLEAAILKYRNDGHDMVCDWSCTLCSAVATRDAQEEEEHHNRPIGRCPKCHTPVYTVEGFCGVCEPHKL